MIAVYPYSLKDQELALKNSLWMLELDGSNGLKEHKVLIVHDHRVDMGTAERIWANLCMLFGSSESLVVAGDFWDHWPESCNLMFSSAARHIATLPGAAPWLWLEPDAIPMRKGWMDAIEGEYVVAVAQGKPFMGDMVDVEKVPKHMSGVAVYPHDLVEAGAGVALICSEEAWDVGASEQILPKMAETKLIQHAWKHPTFTAWSEVENEVALLNTVLFHSSKDGSLIDRLRQHRAFTDALSGGNPERAATVPIGTEHSQARDGEAVAGQPRKPCPPAQNNLPVPMLAEPKEGVEGKGEVGVSSPQTPTKRHGEARESIYCETSRRSNPKAKSDSRGGQVSGCVGTAPHQDTQEATQVAMCGSSAPPAQFICDIFIKTYPADFEWLWYCLRSINKFTKDFRQVIIVSPEPVAHLETLGYKVQITGEQNDGYLWQQVVKLDADRRTDADYILYVDSDCVFTKPTSPHDYFTGDKIDWLYTPYNKTETPWQPMMEKFFKQPIEFEFMRRIPTIVPRWLLQGLRDFCEHTHKMTLDAYILSQSFREFSEFNALGAYAYYFHRDKFNWLNTEEIELPVLRAKQYWSRGGLKPEIKAEIEGVLNETPFTTALELEERFDKGEDVVGYFDTDKAEVAAPNLIDQIRSHADALQAICDGKVGRLHQLRLELRKRKLISRAVRRK